MKLTYLPIVFILCLCFQIAQAKVALVIGNDAYNSSHFGELDKAVSDAKLLANKLDQLGFDVIIKEDLNYEQMLAALDKFSDKLRQSNDVGVFYFAGHSIQEEGNNYLIPLKANIEFSSDAKTKALDASVILNRMQSVNSQVNIFILDACRDNDLPKRKGGKIGLANLAHENTLIAYATQSGKYALDGYFVPSLVKWMGKPLSIGEMFLQVVTDVSATTKGEQVPSFAYSLRNRFYFNGEAGEQNDDVEPEIAEIPHETVVQGIELIHVPAGCFQMGSNDGDDDEKPVHKVCLSAYKLGRYEVTQAQWEQVMGNNPSHFKGANKPVETVSWYDVQKFINKLNRQTGQNFRLPTEAEWEYACRSGGKNQQYCGGNDMDSVAWHSENSNDITHTVGKKQANKWGFFDMSGNVWEWSQDGEGRYSPEQQQDPVGAASTGRNRVLRGGGWGNGGHSLRSASRAGIWPDFYDSRMGFRLAGGD